MTAEARINYRIRAREVRTIDADGGQLGIIPLKDALKAAQEKELDLVEVAPNANPPVCRIMDYGKFRYEQTKREKEAHKKQQGGRLKEIRIKPNIGEHDYGVKLEKAKEFLGRRFKIKISMFFRGRQMVHRDAGLELLKKFIDDLKEFGRIESPQKRLGKMVLVTLGPVSGKMKKDNTKGKNL